MTGPAGDRTESTWRLAAPVAVWGVAGVVVTVLGVLAHRPALAAVGLPLLLGLAWSVGRRPGDPVAPRLRGRDQPASGGRLRAEVDVPAGPERMLLDLRVSAPGHRSSEALVVVPAADRTGGGPRSIGLSLRTVRTGRRDLFRLDHRHRSGDGLLSTPARTSPPLTVTVLPGLRRLGELPAPFRLHGLTGPRPSRRVGNEAELRDIAPFTAGDRTRRIDWRVTSRLNTGPALPGGGLRISQLYVRRSLATSEATTMLVIDSRDQVGPRVLSWGDASVIREDEATSLDIARTAAASLADRYLAVGDRVGLEDLGGFRRPAPPASGRQQQRRLLQRLALSEPEGGEPTPRRRVPRLPSGCLIVVLSTFLDDDPADMAVTWIGAGHRVLIVDTLPPPDLTGANPRLAAAFRLIAMERADRLATLRRAGVEGIRWTRDPDRDPTRDPSGDPAVALALAARIRRPR